MDETHPLYFEALNDARQNNLDSAVLKLQEVIRLSPTFEDAYEALSVLLYNAKRYDESIQILQSWIRINPNSIMARTNLSRCHLAKGSILEAEKEQAEARRLSWQAELKLKKKTLPAINYQDLIERYKKVIALDPADVLGYYSLGTTYLEAGMKRDAADILEKAIEVNPKHSSSYLGLGQALVELGDKVKAKKIYSAGILIADKQGDVMTQKKMEAHLKHLTEN